MNAPRSAASGASAAGSARILLCGVTGFLGAHLLQDLLANTDASLSCLVRGDSWASAERSLLARWSWYTGLPSLGQYASRVRVLVGDVCERQLGLGSAGYEEVADTHSVVINAAANVSEVGAAAQFFRVNTDAVARLIELSRSGAPKALHHVSTGDVKGFFTGAPPFEAFREQQLEAGQVFRTHYAESKYRAEVLLRKAFAAGLAGAVYRVGYVAPHSVTGRFQQNIHQNYATRYVRACVRLGFAPHLPQHELQLNPVDQVARAIVTVMTRNESRGQTYHLDTPHRVSQYDVLRLLHAAGYAIRLFEPAEFLARARQLSQDEDSLSSVLPGPPSGEELHSVPLDTAWSCGELRRLGFEHVRPTSAWLGRFLEHAIDSGFFEAPRFWHAGAIPDGLF
jgi:thioester reductase-like protein